MDEQQFINPVSAKPSGQKRLSKPLLTALILFAALVLCAFVLFATGFFLRSGDANPLPTDKNLPVHEQFYLYSNDKLGFSFQYPKSRAVGYTPQDGAYIYCGENEQPPYVLVCRVNQRKMPPHRYFAQCDKYMLEQFEHVESTPIHQVSVGDKKLYLVRYHCDGWVIERYFEPYESCYIQYSAVSAQEGALDTELYYAASTLRASDDAYEGAYSGAQTTHHLTDIGITINIPDMLKTNELTIGYFATSPSAVLLAVHITQDDQGKPIYNRRDFIDRASESEGFVSGLLGADSATFTEGTENVYNGKSFYCYPMQMQENGVTFQGALNLTNADETGCWLVAYAVRDGESSFDNTLKLLSSCAASIKVP